MVEIFFTVADLSHLQIDAGRDQATLGIVADNCVGRVFILLIELGPGIEAGFGFDRGSSSE